ncbi:MAG: alpha/beta fold hydrolase [Deltaproteobacteria bacterium]|nr:alpha/beta fold hydrolase [Deltaproteobacteria bacterium]
MANVALGKLSLSYLDAGRGPALLLFHAFPLHKEMWLPQVEALSAHYRVVAPDARGLGDSRPAPDVLTMEIMADDAAAVLDHLGVNKVVVCGLSMGGYGALAFWRRHRHRIGGLVLASTRAVADTDDARAGRETFARQALEHGIDWVLTEVQARLQRPVPIPAVATEIERIVRGNTVAGIAAAQRGMAARADSSALLAEIDCPALVIAADDDSYIAPEIPVQMAAQIKRAKVVRIAGAGHLSNLEQPLVFNEALSAFLTELRPERLPP